MKSYRALSTSFVPSEAPGARRFQAVLRLVVASARALVAAHVERRRGRLAAERLNDYWLKDIGLERQPGKTAEQLRIDCRLRL